MADVGQIKNAADDAVERCGHRGRRGRCARAVSSDSILVEGRLEGALDLSYGSARRHRRVIGGNRAHGKPLRREPSSSGFDDRLRTRESSAKRGRRHVVAVAGARRIRHCCERRLGTGRVAQAEVQLEVDADSRR
jgi:hypothetical protein